jgi:hypothetical protein
MRRKAQIKAKWHRRDDRRAAGIILPSGKKEAAVQPLPEIVTEPVAAVTANPAPEAQVPENPAPKA